MEMNKRAYVKPETEVVEIATTQILCSSPGTVEQDAPEFELQN